MDFRFLPVPPELASWVECAWSLEGVSESGRETILPDGRVELVFHSGDRPRREGAAQSAAFVVGQLTEAVQLEGVGRLSTVGVRLRPEAVGSFLRMPAWELRGRFVDMDLVLPKLALGEPLWPALLSHAAACQAPDVAVGHAVSLLGGAVRMDDVARAACLSPRQLDRRFHASVGLSPKAFARLVRFQAVVAAYQAGDWPRWADLALECGFYDQAHLANEFRQFAGASPTEFFRDPSAMALLLARG